MLSKIARMKTFSEKKAAGYTHSILSAVRYIHDLGIVHRDLKCKNIVFSKPGSGGVLKLIDFGESRMVVPLGTYADIVGTCHYLPPEFGRPRSGNELKSGDMWSIGVICFILCCGRPPFSGDTQLQILRRIQSKNKNISFSNGLTASCQAFIRGLLCDHIGSRMDAATALGHEWVIGDTASTAPIATDPYLEMLGQYQQNQEGKLYGHMISAIVRNMEPHHKESMHDEIFELNRVTSHFNTQAVADHLILNTPITSDDESDHFKYPSPAATGASPRISAVRFTEIMEQSEYPEEKRRAAIARLKDDDGMIPLRLLQRYQTDDKNSNLNSIANQTNSQSGTERENRM